MVARRVLDSGPLGLVKLRGWNVRAAADPQHANTLLDEAGAAWCPRGRYSHSRSYCRPCHTWFRRAPGQKPRRGESIEGLFQAYHGVVQGYIRVIYDSARPPLWHSPPAMVLDLGVGLRWGPRAGGFAFRLRALGVGRPPTLRLLPPCLSHPLKP